MSRTTEADAIQEKKNIPALVTEILEGRGAEGVMSAPVDREQLRRDLSDALKAIQHDQDVTGLDTLAASLTTLAESPYAFHGRLIQRNLAAIPRPYGALIWSLVQVIAQLEKEAPPP